MEYYNFSLNLWGMHHSYWTIGADQRRFKWTLQWFIETNENFLQNLQVPSVFSNRFNLSLITSSLILLVICIEFYFWLASPVYFCVVFNPSRGIFLMPQWSTHRLSYRLKYALFIILKYVYFCLNDFLPQT